MKRILFGILAICFLVTTAYAAKTTYVATNKRFNYVKLKQVRGSVTEERAMTHPKKLNVEGLKAALASIKLSRNYIIKKEVDSQQVFDDRSLEFLAPNMVKAFEDATPMEEVVISYLSKDPIFILRNDRLNIADCWIHGEELHVDFKKLFAKVTGDVDKRGNERRAASRAKGLRVKLELGPGQKMAMSNPDEVVLDLNYNYVKAPELKKAPTKGVTMSGEEVPMAGVAADASTSDEAEAQQMAAEGKAKAEIKAVEDATAGSSAASSAKARLKQLDELKKEGLINSKEYSEKRKKILDSL